MKWAQGYLLILFLGAILGPELAPEAWLQPQLEKSYLAPSWPHLMGTDDLGRDLMTRIFLGARVSLGLGLIVAFCCFVLGSTLGLLVADFSERSERVLSRAVEITALLPQLILLSFILSFFSAELKSSRDFYFVLSLCAILTGWFSFYRQARQLTYQEKNKSYVLSAKALGATPWRVLWTHIRPNIFPSLKASLAVSVSSFLLFESSLSFLGLGIRPPMTSWGVLILDGWKVFSLYPYVLLGPALILFLTSYSLNIWFRPSAKGQL
jgi:ABC-type dipeptide/oligopeptide/nickel transport system permease subunit